MTEEEFELEKAKRDYALENLIWTTTPKSTRWPETRRAWRRLRYAWFDLLSAYAEGCASRWSAKRDTYA